MVVSDDKPRRKEAFGTIKDSKILTYYPGFALGHCKVADEYRDLCQLGTGDNTNPPTHAHDGQPMQPERACAGAVFCTTRGDFYEPTSIHFHDGLGRKTPSVTSGGLFARDDETYFTITAAHVLRSPLPPVQSGDSPGQASDQSGSESDDCEITGLEGWDSETDEEMLSSITSHGSITSSSAGSDNEGRLTGQKPLHQHSASATTLAKETNEQVMPHTSKSSAARPAEDSGVHNLLTLGPVKYISHDLDLALVRVLAVDAAVAASMHQIPDLQQLHRTSSSAQSSGSVKGPRALPSQYVQLPREPSVASSRACRPIPDCPGLASSFGFIHTV